MFNSVLNSKPFCAQGIVGEVPKGAPISYGRYLHDATHDSKDTREDRTTGDEVSSKMQGGLDDSDDDNYSQASSTSSIDHLDEPTTSIDPLLSSIDDLETRIVSSLNEFKLHSGIKTNTSNTSDIDIHSELKDILRPVLEIAAHTGPATARSKWHQSAYRPTIDLALEEIHHRLNEELIFPVLLESAQSDLIPSKRAAALGFFHNLHSEYKSPGSYLDYHLVEQTNVGFGASMNMHMNKYTGALYGRTQNKNQDKVSQSDAYLWKQRLIAKEKTSG